MIGVGIGIGFHAAQPFSPGWLFSSAGPGFWFDPSDPNTLFQDTAGTQPVTAVGQTVARMLDKSGRGNHATQATAAKRPTWQVDSGGRGYLSFDGVDDAMETAAIDFTGTDEVFLCAGVRKLSDAAAGVLAEFSPSVSSNNGSFLLYAPTSAATRYSFGSRGTTLRLGSTTSDAYLSPHTAVLSGLGDISGDVCRLRINGAQIAESVLDQGTGNYGNFALYIGGRGGTSVYTNSRLYGLIGLGRTPSEAELAQAERWMAARTGVTL